MADRISLAKELMQSGETELEKAAQPTFEMSVDVINFLPLLEFKEFSEQLELGKVITIEKNDKICYYPALIAIEYDIDERDNFSLAFSSAARPNETAMTIADLLKEASDTSRTVTSNWADLTDFAKNKEAITSLIEAPLNRALRAAQASLSNQEFIIDETGILGRRYKDDSHLTFSDEQVRLINNLLIFTDDNWKTAKTALGKTDYGYGLIAEVIVGELMLGEQLHISNGDGTVVITGDGIAIKDGSNKVVFNADKNGNIIVKNYATSGDLETAVTEINTTIEGIETRVQTIEDDYVTSSVLKQTSDSIMGEVSKDYATKEGSSEKFAYTLVSDKFVLSANGKEVFKATKDGIAVTGSGEFTGAIHAESGEIGGFSIINNSIFDGTTAEGSNIYLGADGRFIAKNAIIKGSGEFDDLTVSESFAVKTASITDKLQANKIHTPLILLGDGSYTITTGAIDTSGVVTAKLQVPSSSDGRPKFTVTLYKQDGTYFIDNAQSHTFNCSARGYLWTVGYKTFTAQVVVQKGEYTGYAYSSEFVMGNYDMDNIRFDATQSAILTFAAGGAASGIIINCDLLPNTNNSKNLGSPDLRFKTICCEEIICTKINGNPYNYNT